MRKKGIALFLSLIFMGAGQIYSRFYLKGIVLLLIEIYMLLHLPQIIVTLTNFKTLGTKVGHLDGFTMVPGDNSLNMLFNGGLLLFILTLFIVLYIVQINDAKNCVLYLEKENRAPHFFGYIKEFYNNNFTAIFLIPACIGIFALIILPMLLTVLVAFTNYSAPAHIPPKSLFHWVGFFNFMALVKLKAWSYTFFGVFVWTMIFAILATFFNFTVGLILAMLTCHKSIKLKGLWRGIFILPYAIPAIVSIMVFRLFFNISGPLNNILGTHIPFLTDPLFAKVMIVAINTWIGAPYFMVLLSGALNNVSESLYEAAEIDGAKKWAKFKNITLPIVLYQTAPVLVLTFAFNFNNFNIIYLLNGGGPINSAYRYAGSTDILISWVYSMTVSQSQFAIAAVISIFIFLFIAAISLFAFLKTKAFKEEGMIQ